MGLNVGDVAPDGRKIAWRITLDPKLTEGERGSVIFLTPRMRETLHLYLAWKQRSGESLAADAPLFLSNQKRRMSKRWVQVLFAKWQRAARFDRIYNFHALRHTAITNVYRATRDLYLAQRFARHASPLTTTAYAHPSDEELYEAIRRVESAPR